MTFLQDLQQATASEPLTIEEEYAMQRSWRTDHDKLTFIICAPLDNDIATASRKVVAGKDDAAERMIGDVNLFLVEAEDDDDDDDDDHETKDSDAAALVVGELEIMIARKDLQRRGYGRSTLLVFIDYILRNLQGILDECAAGNVSSTGNKPQLDNLRVRIGSQNSGSLKLFEGLGFRRVTEQPNYFGELELRLDVNTGTATQIAGLKGYETARDIAYDDTQV